MPEKKEKTISGPTLPLAVSAASRSANPVEHKLGIFWLFVNTTQNKGRFYTVVKKIKVLIKKSIF